LTQSAMAETRRLGSERGRRSLPSLLRTDSKGERAELCSAAGGVLAYGGSGVGRRVECCGNGRQRRCAALSINDPSVAIGFRRTRAESERLDCLGLTKSMLWLTPVDSSWLQAFTLSTRTRASKSLGNSK